MLFVSLAGVPTCHRRLKSISDQLLVAANNAGSLQLTVETSVVSVKTYFKDLENPSWDEKDEVAKRNAAAQKVHAKAKAAYAQKVSEVGKSGAGKAPRQKNLAPPFGDRGVPGAAQVKPCRRMARRWGRSS